MTQVVHLPYKYTPRDYQKPLWRAFFNEGKSRLVQVWHRRAGKDKTDLNVLLAASQQRVGTYFYLLPELKQARRDIWENIDGDGLRFLDHIPKELVVKKNNTEMTIQFINGSILRLCGADRKDALMGSNPVGIIFGEYSLQSPQAWDYLSPVILENGGWAIFQFTPRGSNHAFELYNMAKGNDKWFAELLTVEHTFKNNGQRVYTDEQIQSERDTGKSEDFLQQEYYCSFDAAVRGAYFSSQLAAAQDDNRIIDFGIDTTFGVFTFWDLGYRDSTAIWFAQQVDGKIYLIHYYENQGQPVQHYINYVNDFAVRSHISYIKHFCPHDGEKNEYGSGITIRQLAQRMGLRFETSVKRIGRKRDAIEMARNVFHRCTFHKTHCKLGLGTLREYHAEYNESMQVYSEEPVRNWATHGADAFMTMAQSDFFVHQRPLIQCNAGIVMAGGPS